MKKDLNDIYADNLTKVEKPIKGDLELTIQGETSREVHFFRGDYTASVKMYWHAMSDSKVILCTFH